MRDRCQCYKPALGAFPTTASPPASAPLTYRGPPSPYRHQSASPKSKTPEYSTNPNPNKYQQYQQLHPPPPPREREPLLWVYRARHLLPLLICEIQPNSRLPRAEAILQRR